MIKLSRMKNQRGLLAAPITLTGTALILSALLIHVLSDRYNRIVRA